MHLIVAFDIKATVIGYLDVFLASEVESPLLEQRVQNEGRVDKHCDQTAADCFELGLPTKVQPERSTKRVQASDAIHGSTELFDCESFQNLFYIYQH